MSFWAIATCHSHDLSESSRDDSFALLCVVSHHCVGFTTACLPVSEDGSIVSIQYIVYQGKCTLFI